MALVRHVNLFKRADGPTLGLEQEIERGDENVDMLGDEKIRRESEDGPNRAPEKDMPENIYHLRRDTGPQSAQKVRT